MPMKQRISIICHPLIWVKSSVIDRKIWIEMKIYYFTKLFSIKIQFANIIFNWGSDYYSKYVNVITH